VIESSGRGYVDCYKKSHIRREMGYNTRKCAACPAYSVQYPDYEIATCDGTVMSYSKDFSLLKELLGQSRNIIEVGGCNIEILKLPFVSRSASILPGGDEYRFEDHCRYFVSQMEAKVEFSSPPVHEILHVLDSDIPENKAFFYPVFKQKSSPKASGAIILIHGLNEKTWDKYLPWAKKLLELTGKAVLLFPIAFHMNRAPKEWSNYRLMSRVSKERKKIFPTVVQSTFANAAISTRLQLCPQRFFWSGLQSYYDVIQLVREIRSGQHTCIRKDASIDFFGYSIGAFLTQLLLMADPDRVLERSRLFIFCGGPTMNRMSPVSMYILDSEANIAIYSFYVENFEEELKRDRRLADYFTSTSAEGQCFRAMLDYHKLADFRESRFREIGERITALGLDRDTVIPGYEITNTLKGREREIQIRIETMDFPYQYTHEDPFPNWSRIMHAVDRSFSRVFRYAAKFFE
jgi:pimeloyl-ACP methyl ester carboxylesterase